jgi:lycopene cyclase domain-containing protein
MFTYLLVNVLSIAIPFIYSFNKRLNFYKTWYAFWPAALVTGAVFIYWDVYFTQWGVWGFNPRHLMGIDLVNLPLEEWLFFICIPYACVFTYYCLNILVEKDYLGPYARGVTGVFIVVLILVATFNLNRLYTSITFISTAIFLLLHLFVFKSEYLGRFYLANIIIFLMPFMLVNGILTGSFITEEVVWYNNAENLGVRIFTIPVEDFIYGMLLILMNVTIYEALIKMREKSRTEAVSTSS